MKVEINGLQITLTDEQLKEIAKQTQKPERWQDKLNISTIEGKYSIGVRYNYELEPNLISKYSREPHKLQMIFRNYEQAELLAKKCNLMIEMYNFAYAMNDGEIANHNDSDVERFGIDMLYNYPRVNSNYRINSFVFGVCVKSEEIAEQMLAEFGDRIKEVYNTQY